MAVRRLLLAAAVASFATLGFGITTSASACTGDICDGICDFWNAHRHPVPQVDLRDCPIR
jgi:hypothetical protein